MGAAAAARRERDGAVAFRIAERWFERRRIDAAITLLWEPHVDPLIRCNIWHLRGRDADLMIDTGLGIASLAEAARDLLDKPIQAVATHTHYDHIGGHHEFATCLVHPAEAEALRHAERSAFASLFKADIPPGIVASIEASGYPLPDVLVTAVPRRGFDPRLYGLRGARGEVATVDEGDRIDLGDRTLEVLHLPGHSPGSIGLWDRQNGVLFSGDAIYDGPLLDNLPGADRADYIATLKRLRELPVEVVHAGHDPSFGRARLREIAGKYLDLWQPA